MTTLEEVEHAKPFLTTPGDDGKHRVRPAAAKEDGKETCRVLGGSRPQARERGYRHDEDGERTDCAQGFPQ